MDRRQQDFKPSYAQYSLATPLNLSQTIERYTLVVKRAYADGHVLNIIVASDAEQQNEQLLYEAQLTDSEGNKYPSDRHSLDELDTSLSFKLPPDTSLSPLFHLHLGLSVTGKMRPSYDGGPPIIPAFEAPVGPFGFDFSLPLFPARIVEVNQTTDANGMTVTLERLSIAPSGVRFYLRFPRPADGTPALAWVRLQTPDAPSSFSYRGGAYTSYGKESASGTFADPHFDEVPLYRQSGEWTLRVDSMQYRDISQPVTSQRAKIDPQSGVVGAWGV